MRVCDKAEYTDVVLTVIGTEPSLVNLSGPHPDEIKEGQWLGVSVSSQGPGKKAVVCAHRSVV